MRLVSVLLFIGGIALALLGPLVWEGRVPVVLGAVCVLVAALLAARRNRLALGGVVLAVLLFLTPGLVNGWRNGRGIAWEVPKGEVVELAAAGYAITSRHEDQEREDSPSRLIGRDIDSGARRWRTAPSFEGVESVGRVGQTLLVVDRNGVLHALDTRTGKQRWASPPAERNFPEISDGRTVAALRCEEGLRCTVEARALADGSVRWSAPADFDNSFLGAPRLTRDSSVTPPVWPATFVIVHLPDRARYEARDLQTGRVLTSGSTKRTETASIGNVFVRADDTTLTATDIGSGRVLWRRPTRDGVPVNTADRSSRMLAVVDGGLLLASDSYLMPDVKLGDPIRILDPRDGKVAEHPGVFGYVGVIATGTATPGVPLVRKFGDEEQGQDQLLVDGRRYARERIDPFEIAATTTQAGFKSTLSVYGLGKRRAVEVYDRRGGRVARFVAVGARVRSAGERLVISVGNEDDRRSYVVRGR